jgi:hypothetical protein
MAQIFAVDRAVVVSLQADTCPATTDVEDEPVHAHGGIRLTPR